MLGRAVLISILAAAPASGAPPDSLRLVLNLPSYKLEVWDGAERIRNYWVTIGLPDYPTPTGGFEVTRVEWNPWWTPPESPWAEGKTKKAPGPGNPMGRAKLQFDEMLYLHGTYRPDELGGPYSHGCVRLKNADVLDLARLLALRTGALSPTEIRALERHPQRNRSVRLPVAIPLRIRYALTAEVEGEVVDLRDPYGWGDQDGRRAPAVENTEESYVEGVTPTP